MADTEIQNVCKPKEKSFVFNDGGRAAAGYKGSTGDCVVRAIAIATGQNYQKVYEGVNQIAGKKVARTGVPMAVSKKYLTSLGWVWKPSASDTRRIAFGKNHCPSIKAFCCHDQWSHTRYFRPFEKR